MMYLHKFTRWSLKGDPEMGKTLTAQGRPYTLVCVCDELRHDRVVEFFIWDAVCVTCGETFEHRSTRSRFNATANCERHRPKHREKF